jgi:hypothetical protein
MRRAVVTLALSSTLACGPADEADAGALDTLGVADGGEDALSLDAPATPDAGAPCCVASHYASFPIPSTPGSGLPHEARYTVGLEQVVDEITGLTWQLHTDGVRRSLEEALAYCDALELGGRRDFVLPSRIELVTLLELERSPTVAPSLLPTEAEYHWTRSRYVARPASAFSVYFGAGAIEFGRGENRSALARCVAPAVPGSEGVGPVIEGDRAHDAATGLTWERAALGPLTFAQAEAACADAGMDLPTLRELASLLDDARTTPAIDVAVLGLPAGPTWTASRTTSSSERWIVDLDDGRSRPLAESERASVRCVVR